MRFASHHRRLCTPTMLAVALLATAGVARADTKAIYKQLFDEAAPALVTIKCVLKVQGSSGAQEQEREFTALMIEPKGLVLCSSLQLGTSRLYRRMATSITPTDIKVLIGDDTEGVEAKFLTSDPELDLSWVEIKTPDEKGYTSLDLSKGVVPALGDRLLSGRRMDKFFDRAFVVNEGYLGGTTKKPRELLVPTASLEFTQTSIGMPVFDDHAAVVGVAVLQSPDPEDEGGTRGSADVLILPVAEVVKATERARTAANEAEEEEEDEEGEEGAAAAKANSNGDAKSNKNANVNANSNTNATSNANASNANAGPEEEEDEE
ncbi:MAG TPA: hypothetical protein VNT79_00450 [Phycisphaerae bacterium]|nr:hypothetical protein [Phycisphaerae bacterium]